MKIRSLKKKVVCMCAPHYLDSLGAKRRVKGSYQDKAPKGGPPSVKYVIRASRVLWIHMALCTGQMASMWTHIIYRWTETEEIYDENLRKKFSTTDRFLLVFQLVQQLCTTPGQLKPSSKHSTASAWFNMSTESSKKRSRLFCSSLRALTGSWRCWKILLRKSRGLEMGHLKFCGGAIMQRDKYI